MKGWTTIAGALVLAGCASVTRGTTEQVQFDSEPSGAEMRSTIIPKPQQKTSEDYYGPIVDMPPQSGPACVTPCALEVPRNQALMATFSKPGYQPQTLKIDTRVADQGVAAFAGNAIVGGVVGGLVDVGTGAALNHTPNPAKVILVPIKTPNAVVKPRSKGKPTT